MIIDVITGLFYLIHAWDRIRVHHQHITQLLTGNPLNAYRYYSDVQRREKKNRPGFYGQGGLNPIITAEFNCWNKDQLPKKRNLGVIQACLPDQLCAANVTSYDETMLKIPKNIVMWK